MNHHLNSTDLRSRAAMTLVEVLLVVSLMGMVGLAIFNALNNGIKVWDVGRRLVVEEDISLFFDKLSRDLRNLYVYSHLKVLGKDESLTFPTVIRTPVDPYSSLPLDAMTDQLGMVEYYFDFVDRGIHRRAANYSESMEGKFALPLRLVANVDNLRFRYYYMTDTGEVYSDGLLADTPSGVEAEVTFTDRQGKRSLKKFIEVPLAR